MNKSRALFIIKYTFSARVSLWISSGTLSISSLEEVVDEGNTRSHKETINGKDEEDEAILNGGGEDNAGGTLDLQSHAESRRDRDGRQEEPQEPAVFDVDHAHRDRDDGEVKLALERHPVLSGEALKAWKRAVRALKAW